MSALHIDASFFCHVALISFYANNGGGGGGIVLGFYVGFVMADEVKLWIGSLSIS